jgi:DNA-binding GntR family transcriptional regulator
MSTSIKRLEIIKNAIELEDDDIIQSQLTRLKNEAFDDELQAIVVALEKKNYTAAMAAITAWLQGQRRDPVARSAGGRQQAGTEGAGRTSARSD